MKLLILPGLAAIGYPKRAAAFAILMIAMGFLSLGHVRFDNDVVRAITSDSDWSRTYLEFVDRIEQESFDIAILAEAQDGFSKADLSALRDLWLDVELSEGVITVLSPFSARFPRNHPTYPEETVVPLDPAPEQVARRLAQYAALPHALNPMLNEELETALAIVVIDKSSVSAESILEEIRLLVERASAPGINLTVTGKAAISIEIVDALKRDLLWLNLFGDMIGVAIAAVIFRRPAAILTATAPALTGALMSMSIFAFTGLPITVLSNVITILVYVLGLSDGTHLVAYFTSLDRKRDKRNRVLETVRRIGPACGLTAVTTAVAFAAIAMSNNEPLREFAIVGALATIAAYCSVILWFVLLALWFDPAISGKQAGLPLPPVPAAIKRLALDKPRIVVAAGATLMFIAAAGYVTTTPWFSVYENLPESSPVRIAAETAEKRFGGFFELWAEYPAPDRDTPEGWSALLQKTRALEDRVRGGNAITPATVSSWLGNVNQPPNANEIADVANPLVDLILPPGEDVARVLILTGDPMRTPEQRRNHDILEATAAASGAKVITGLSVLMRHEPIDIVRQLSIGLAAACVICVVLIAAVYRNIRLVPALLLPNLLPLAVTASALHVLRDSQLNPTALLALTIAFGIAVDDSIHLVNRYFMEQRAGREERQAISHAIDAAGKAVIATTLLICGGLLVTFASDFSTIRLFGIMLIITFAVALAADLLLLPALLRLRWFR